MTLPLSRPPRVLRPRHARPRRAGKVVGLVVGVLVLGGAAAAGVMFAGGGMTDAPEATIDTTQLHTVARGDFDIVIPVSGELAAERQVEIRNLVEGRAVITEIVDEGTFVRKGQVLLKLADDEIIDRIKDGEDQVKTAESNVVSAEQNLEIRRSTMASDLEKSDLEIQIAELDLQAWREGDVVSKRQSLDLAIEKGTIERDRLKKRFEDAKSLVEQGFISFDEYEQDRIRLIEAEAALKEAGLAKQVYESYTIKQEEAEKVSAVEQSTAEKGRVRQRHLAEIVRIEADVESARFKLQTARERLEDLRTQLEACVVIAPNDGLVVYASSLGGERRGRDNEPPPQVGTELRQNELVMILPDTSRMIANLKVGEALSGRVREGQEAVVFSDSSPNQPVRGTVLGVSVLAESGGWRDPNRRDYTVRVLLEAPPELGLKPSMRCRGDIKLGRVEGAVSVPIQAVFRKGPLAYVYVPEGTGFAPKVVDIGRSSEMSVEVLDGLAEGESVLLRRPSPGEVVRELELPEGGEGGSRWAGRGGGRPGAASGGQGSRGGSGASKGRDSAKASGTGSADAAGSGGQKPETGSEPKTGSMAGGDRPAAAAASSQSR